MSDNPYPDGLPCALSVTDSPEEAIEKAKAGEYDNPDSEPGEADARSYRVEEGEHGSASVKRKYR